MFVPVDGGLVCVGDGKECAILIVDLGKVGGEIGGVCRKGGIVD
jgi:hypothetical protein